MATEEVEERLLVLCQVAVAEEEVPLTVLLLVVKVEAEGWNWLNLAGVEAVEEVH